MTAKASSFPDGGAAGHFVSEHVLIDGLSMVYESSKGRLEALNSIDLAIGRGEFVSIIGPSGCGKSTLLRIIGGLQSPTHGRVLIDGAPPAEAQRHKAIGFVFQDASLLPWRTVIENVRLPLQVNRGAVFARAEMGSARPEVLEGRDRCVAGGASRASARADIGSPEVLEGRARGAAGGASRASANTVSPDHLVELVGLGAFRDYYPHQLSGGMQQRVALARALVTSPSLLLMDEPFGALDEITRSAMRYELLHIWRAAAAERGCTVVFVTHSITEAVLLSDRVVVLTPQPGRIADVLDIDLPRPRPEELEHEPAFLDYARHLRSLLRERSSA
jgi:NitT/TauT family transport system ATP-binding protein